MYRYKPTIYKKSIYDIDYDKLYKNGIRCLIYDLDNTLGLISELECPKKTKMLIEKLKKNFKIYIITNNNKKRVMPYIEELGIEAVTTALKPSVKGLTKIKNKEKLKKEEMAIIGDQIVTDILAGNKYKITSILVDPLGKKDLKITGFNRFIENIILKNYKKKNIMERGKYYG